MKARNVSADESGVVAIIFALSLVVLMTLVGFATDLGNVYHVRAHIQGALDNAALAAGRAAQLSHASDPLGKATSTAQAFWSEHKPKHVELSDLSVTSLDAGTKFKLTATATVKTPFLAALGTLTKTNTSKLIAVTSATAALVVPKMADLELVIVLDLSGSMTGQAQDALQSGAKDLLDIAIWPGPNDYKARAALVQFSDSVQVETAAKFKKYTNHQDDDRLTCPYSQPACQTPQPIKYYRWCVSPRVAFTLEGPPLAGQANTYLKTLTDEVNQPQVNVDNTACKPSLMFLQGFIPLTSNTALIKQRIDLMTSGGQSDGQIGLSFAWYALSPLWSDFGWDAAPYSAQTRKIVVLYTDGAFQMNNSQRTPAQIKARAQGICALMKEKPGVQIFVLWANYEAGSDSAIKSCGTTSAHSYDLTSTSAIQAGFRDIALRISTLRLVN